MGPQKQPPQLGSQSGPTVVLPESPEAEPRRQKLKQHLNFWATVSASPQSGQTGSLGQVIFIKFLHKIFLKIFVYLFIWLCQFLVAACGIFNLC